MSHVDVHYTWYDVERCLYEAIITDDGLPNGFEVRLLTNDYNHDEFVENHYEFGWDVASKCYTYYGYEVECSVLLGWGTIGPMLDWIASHTERIKISLVNGLWELSCGKITMAHSEFELALAEFIIHFQNHKED